MLPLMILVAVLIWFVLGVVRAFVRVWLRHRARLVALERGESPGSADSLAIDSGKHDENYVVSGALLGILGVAAIACGWYLGQGATAVGVYVAGFICTAFGLLVALLGIVLRGLASPPATGESEPTL